MRVLWSGEAIFATSDLWLHPTVTTWLCGCPLKCPFCHNWRIAEALDCKREDIETFTEKVMKVWNEYKEFAEYVHITGGEPALQPEAVRALAERAPVSLNSSLCVRPQLFAKSLEVVEHLAFDIKLPFAPMIGYVENWHRLARYFVENLKAVVKSGKPFEARVPVAKKITLEAMDYEGTKKLFALLAEGNVEVIVVQPLLSEKMGITPRDPKWPFANPSKEEVFKVAEKIEKLVGEGVKVAVREDMARVLEDG